MHQVAEKTDLSLPRVEAWDSFVTHKLCESKLMANSIWLWIMQKIITECIKNILGLECHTFTAL